MEKKMNSIYEKLTTCLASVREKTDFGPETAIVLGSGLGDYAEQIKIETTIDYKDIKGFPTSTVPDTRAGLYLDMWIVCLLSSCRAEYIIMRGIR